MEQLNIPFERYDHLGIDGHEVLFIVETHETLPLGSLGLTEKVYYVAIPRPYDLREGRNLSNDDTIDLMDLLDCYSFEYYEIYYPKKLIINAKYEYFIVEMYKRRYTLYRNSMELYVQRIEANVIPRIMNDDEYMLMYLNFHLNNYSHNFNVSNKDRRKCFNSIPDRDKVLDEFTTMKMESLLVGDWEVFTRQNIYDLVNLAYDSNLRAK